MAFLDKNVIFRPYFELEAIARQSVEASREVICAYFGNIGRNSGYFLHPIFLAVHPSVHSPERLPITPDPLTHLSIELAKLKTKNCSVSTRLGSTKFIGPFDPWTF